MHTIGSVAEDSILALHEYSPDSPYRENWAVVDCLIERLGLENQRELVARTFRLLCGESLRVAPRPREERTSVISHARLPLEYSFTTEEKGGALRLLTEVAPPSRFLPERYEATVRCLKAVRPLLGLEGDDGALERLLETLFPENMGALDEPWYNGVMWVSVRFAEGARPILRIYANQQINNNTYRFGKIARALRQLGLVHDIPLLNEIEEQVESWGWLSGLSFDLYPGGRIAGVKVFVGAELRSTRPEHLRALTAATGLSVADPALMTFLRRVGLGEPQQRASSPALLCSFALPDRPGGSRSIKLDATVQGLFSSDFEAYRAADDLFHSFRVHPGCLRAAEDLFFAEGLSRSCVQTLQYVGVQVRSDGRVGMNVYLSPGTSRPERRPETFRLSREANSPPRSGNVEEHRRALLAGSRFLLRRQSPGGGFWDLAVSVGSSGPWLTGLVGEALLNVADLGTALPSLPAALAAAADYLERARLPEGGYGYNEALPPDCDSTAHALWFLARMGRSIPEQSRVMLEAFADEQGAFLTYMGSPPGHSWGVVHQDVHPAGVRALAALAGADAKRVRRGLDRMLAAAAEEPVWPAFWWTTRAYGIYVNVACLEELGELSRVTSDLRRRLIGRLRDDDPLNCALSVLVCSALKVPAADPFLSRCVEKLLAEQLSDGGWMGSRSLQVVNADCPAPWAVRDAEQAGPIYPERKRLFTAALAVRALARYSKGLSSC